MFTGNREKKHAVAAAIIITLTGILLIPVFPYLNAELSKSERVNANLLLVEGWVPASELNLVVEEWFSHKYDLIVTTGIKSTSDYFNMYSNGFLIFYTNGFFKDDFSVKKHFLEVKASSSLQGENKAKFHVLANNSLIGSFEADKKKRIFRSEWTGSLSELDSVSIQFLNDKSGSFGDRDLFVREIMVDDKFVIPYQKNSTYFLSGPKANIRLKNNFESFAELARNNLISMGIDSASIIEIPAKNVSINRTLASSLAFREWLKGSDPDLEGINIMTLGTHARRTLMTYKKILGKKYNVGIISLPDRRANQSERIRITKTLREIFGLIYYRIILIPY